MGKHAIVADSRAREKGLPAAGVRCFVAAVQAGLAEFKRGCGPRQAQAVRQAIVDALEWRPPEPPSTGE